MGGDADGSAGGCYVGGRVFGEGSTEQSVLAFAGGLVGGGLGYGAGARSVSGGRTLTYQPKSGAVLRTQPGKMTTVLGSYATDMKHVVGELGNVKSTNFGARPNGFNVLNVPDHLYRTPSQIWREYNEPWLANAVSRRDPVVMATDPRFGPGSPLIREDRATGMRQLTGFGREYSFLRRHGYRYDPATRQMLPP